MDLSRSHVDKHKSPIHHIMVAYYNVEGCGHELLEFHVSTKALFNLQVPVTEGLKTNSRRRRSSPGEGGQ